MRFHFDLAWTESIWARLAGWPVVALLSWQVWRMLPPGIHGGMSLSALQGVAEPAFLTFACSALFLIIVCGYGPFPGIMGLGPDWTSPIAAYLLFPFIAVLLLRWTNLHGWSVPIIAISPALALEILFTLMFTLMGTVNHAIERRFPSCPEKTPSMDYRLGGGLGGFGPMAVGDLSWREVLRSHNPDVLVRAATEARAAGAPEMADILEKRSREDSQCPST
ncbi:hypothetical protein [Acidithiobacillus ferrianus]|uniref:hypothetical protein n=1 Tax=Acidithiobacillus ferrianus TaxID=2678518 RepID=UPI0034E618E9